LCFLVSRPPGGLSADGFQFALCAVDTSCMRDAGDTVNVWSGLNG
jgi:hypothetical protein